jgi:putative nucleotidyltransferase with HDIG domain
MPLASGASKAAETRELCWDPESVPPFPAVALKALKLMAGTDTSLLELCNLIRADLAFSTAILRVANSPLVAFPKDITSVLQASMLLGFGRLRSVAITVGLRAYFSSSFTPLMKLCWRHSVACAIVAERSAKFSFLDNEFAYTAGILHDIGRVGLATIMPTAYSRVIDGGADQPQHLLQIEREFCGIDHCQAGKSLAAAWNLPPAFAEIVACHHDPPARSGTGALVPHSCALADSLGFAVLSYRSPRTYAEVLADFPEPARTRLPVDPGELAAGIDHEIKVFESV